MITLLASLAGFVSSIFPDIIKYFSDKNDKLHELSILDRQIDMQKSGHTQRIEEINVLGEIMEAKALYQTYSTGITWVDALNGTVRPILAYSFFFLYALVKMLQFISIPEGSDVANYLEILWTTEDQAIFAGIISFYYGQRTIAKIRGRK